MNRVIYLLAVIMFINLGCRRNPLKPDISSVKVNLQINRLDLDLFNLNPENKDIYLSELKNKYGSFFVIYSRNILSIGDPSDPAYFNYLSQFLDDSIRIQTKKKTDSVFSDLSLIKSKLEKAFRYYKYYFPGKRIPQIITMISGFNQSIVTTEDAIGISLDNYLGPDCSFYRMLGLTEYKKMNMYPEKIPTDALYGWAKSEFEPENSGENLLSVMITEGKLMYLLDALFPDEPDYLKIGYKPEKIKWCMEHEAGMWTYLVENKLLFNTDRMNIRRFTGPGPFTNSFTQDSPGKAGVWIGWQIVRRYMQKSQKITPGDLMRNKDFNSILNQSGYDPE